MRTNEVHTIHLKGIYDKRQGILHMHVSSELISDLANRTFAIGEIRPPDGPNDDWQIDVTETKEEPNDNQ